MGENAASPGADCPLDQAAQARNLLLFAGCTALQYLAAPVGYVGLTQASLCHELGSSDAVANLPETAYLGLTFAPILFAWLVPYVAWLRRNLVICYGAAAVSQAAVGLALLAPLPPGLQIAAVIAQAAVAGCMVPSAIAFLWEVLGRGVSEKRRGLALGLAFGVGPLFAVLGSLGAQYVLTRFPAPGNFAVLYLAAAPAMAVNALLSCFFVVPAPAVEAVRQPFRKAVFGGLGDFLRDRVLLTATVVTILIYTGNTITANLNLYSKEVFGEAPMLRAGNQNAMRFAFKTAAGLLLGWLLTRTNPKVGLLTTSLLFLASVAWALVASAETYLLVFGIFGAGELVGVYAPNYILSASRKEDMRRNMAFVTMMMAPAAPAGYLFGLISDIGGVWFGKAAGFRISFAVCAGLMLTGIVLAAVLLPAKPSRAEAVGPGVDGQNPH
jgi:MFS family permease